MTSEWKAAANRKNAAKSSGPRTVAGKNVSRSNALRHGLTAETLVALGEDAGAFQRMADEHLAVFRPRNAVELECARTFTLAAWRRLRCVTTETAMINQYIHDTALAEQIGEEQDVLALGERLFFDSKDLWRFHPDPVSMDCPRFPRKEVPGGPDTPARLVKELESTYAGCRWLLHRWEELRVRNQPGKWWKAFDKFKAIRLLGKQPLDVLTDDPCDLLTIFLASHQVHAVNKGPFSELRCEVDDEQFGVLRRWLEQMDIDGYKPAGEDDGRRLLDKLIAEVTDRLERIASRHKKQTEAEAAERTRRLAFDPGEAADKLRRYEETATRRMTRACEDLAKLRRTGMFDEDLERGEEPGAGEPDETSARIEETCCDSRTTLSETPVQDSPAAFHPDRVAPDDNTDLALEAAPEELDSPAAAQASVTTVHAPRFTPPGNGSLLKALLLVVGFWWLLASGQWAALRGIAMSPSFPARAACRSVAGLILHNTRVVVDSLAPSVALLLAPSPWGEGASISLRHAYPTDHRLSLRKPLRLSRKGGEDESILQNEATANCAGYSATTHRLMVAAQPGNARGANDCIATQPLTRRRAALQRPAAATTPFRRAQGRVGSTVAARANHLRRRPSGRRDLAIGVLEPGNVLESWENTEDNVVIIRCRRPGRKFGEIPVARPWWKD